MVERLSSRIRERDFLGLEIRSEENFTEKNRGEQSFTEKEI